jgi:hypothetical protein
LARAVCCCNLSPDERVRVGDEPGNAGGEHSTSGTMRCVMAASTSCLCSSSSGREPAYSATCWHSCTKCAAVLSSFHSLMASCAPPAWSPPRYELGQLTTLHVGPSRVRGEALTPGASGTTNEGLATLSRPMRVVCNAPAVVQLPAPPLSPAADRMLCACTQRGGASRRWSQGPRRAPGRMSPRHALAPRAPSPPCGTRWCRAHLHAARSCGTRSASSCAHPSCRRLQLLPLAPQSSALGSWSRRQLRHATGCTRAARRRGRMVVRKPAAAPGRRKHRLRARRRRRKRRGGAATVYLPGINSPALCLRLRSRRVSMAGASSSDSLIGQVRAVRAHHDERARNPPCPIPHAQVTHLYPSHPAPATLTRARLVRERGCTVHPFVPFFSARRGGGLSAAHG